MIPIQDTRKRRMLRLVSAALLLFAAGCLSQHALIERRIRERAEFFSALPPENQQRLREGHVKAGDTPDAVWIVYGRPDRVYQRATATATNEVWSYEAQAVSNFDEPRPVIVPVRAHDGRLYWMNDYLWEPRTHFDLYEYLRIEFQDGRVLSIESEHP